MDIVPSATTKESYGFQKQIMDNLHEVTDVGLCPSEFLIVHCNYKPMFMVSNIYYKLWPILLKTIIFTN